MTTLATVYRRAADVRYRVLDDEAVVIRQRAGEVLGLNALGARLLDALDGLKPVGEIVASPRPRLRRGTPGARARRARFLRRARGAGAHRGTGSGRRAAEMSGFGGKVESIWRENRLFTVLLELTYRCNLDCFFCYNDVSLQGTPLATEQYFALLDELARARHAAALALGRRAARPPRLLPYRRAGAGARFRRADQVERTRAARRARAAGARRDRPLRHRGQPARRARRDPRPPDARARELHAPGREPGRPRRARPAGQDQLDA